MFVRSFHDMNQFVAVHFFVKTSAVQSLGKSCKDHGYSHDWVSGQGPRFTKNGKTLSAMQNGQFRTSCRSRIVRQFWKQFVLSSLSQDSLRREAEQASGNTAASSSSSGSVFERSDEQATWRRARIPKKSQTRRNRDDKKDGNDPLANS